jgi:hypothetical protein
LSNEMKAWIDNASYESLLERWRNSPVGSPWFQGDLGDYYAKVMRERREKVGDAEHVRASKSIGWKGPRS